MCYFSLRTLLFMFQFCFRKQDKYSFLHFYKWYFLQFHKLSLNFLLSVIYSVILKNTYFRFIINLQIKKPLSKRNRTLFFICLVSFHRQDMILKEIIPYSPSIKSIFFGFKKFPAFSLILDHKWRHTKYKDKKDYFSSSFCH